MTRCLKARAAAPHRALVNRAAARRGHPASILHAKDLMSPSPGQSVPGPAEVGGAMLTRTGGLLSSEEAGSASAFASLRASGPRARKASISGVSKPSINPDSMARDLIRDRAK